MTLHESVVVSLQFDKNNGDGCFEDYDVQVYEDDDDNDLYLISGKNTMMLMMAMMMIIRI